MNRENLRSDILLHARISFALSGGPGGQNVNKVNTRAVIHLPLGSLASLTPAERERAEQKLANRVNGEGCLVVESSTTRSQFRNRQEALRIAEELIADALKVQRKRRPTRPTRASEKRRLAAKKRKGTVKKNRGRVQDD